MSPLILVPELSEMSIEEIELHITQVRARRMTAALEHMAGQNLKLSHEADKTRRKIMMEYERLGRALNKLDLADELVQKSMIKIEELKEEFGFSVSKVQLTSTTTLHDEGDD